VFNISGISRSARLGADLADVFLDAKGCLMPMCFSLHRRPRRCLYGGGQEITRFCMGSFSRQTRKLLYPWHGVRPGNHHGKDISIVSGSDYYLNPLPEPADHVFGAAFLG